MVKISVCKVFSFSAAHRLPSYQGPCENLHGHNWKLEVGITGEVNVDTGFIIDFKEIKTMVTERIISVVDHKYLNEIEHPGFPKVNPTAENMLFWMAHTLKKYIHSVKLDFIRLWETDTSFAEWRDI